MTTVVQPYRDGTQPTAARVTDLLGRMTRAEKLAQLGALWGYELIDGTEPDLDQLRLLGADGIGHISRISGSTNLRPSDAARVTNAIQRFLVEDTRLGIPAIVHEECLHGVLAVDAPSFQQSIGAAATFDEELIGAVAATIRERLLVTGARQGLGPVLDISRDPRWGRIEETYGEDPYLAAALGAAFVRGLQGPNLGEGVVATGKHLVGHGMAEGGLNQAPVHIGTRELNDEQFVPFETAVVEAGLKSLMPAYCDVDGLPCHADRQLLTSVLRERWGFDGIVVSDYGGVEMLKSAHRMTTDRRTAAMLAFAAGVDVELPRTDIYGKPLSEAIDANVVPEAALDAVVARILQIKFELGLFDRPYVPVLEEPAVRLLAAREAIVGRALALRSLVLVANQGVLPLSDSARSVAIIGEAADSAREFLGDYSHFVHLETLAATQRSGSNAFGIVDTGREITLEDELAGRVTLLDELRKTLQTREVMFARGVGVHGGTDADIAQAVEVASGADVAIVVVAERSGLTPDSTTGEFRDRRDLSMSGRQQEMLEAVVATGTPVILVVVSGRPLALEWAAANCAAILLAWVPGDFGPAAIADVIVGAEEPGGRLPISMPRNVGQVPLNYRHHPTGGRSNPLGDYVDGSASPLWSFGYGLGYTRYELSNLRIDRSQLPTSEGSVLVQVDVTNCGERTGDEVVQLYVRDEEASVARPLIELRGFRRVTLAPGETGTVEFELLAEQLAYTGADNVRVVEPGSVVLSVGTCASDTPLRTTIELIGPTIALPVRHHALVRSRVL